MDRRDIVLLVITIILAAVAIFVDLNIDHPDWLEDLLVWQPEGTREIAIQQGLDLQGGLQVLLAADVADNEQIDADAMETARQIVENRVNALGLTEPVVQRQGERRIIVELPGVSDPELAIETIQGTALLEFVDTGGVYLPPDTIVATTEGGPTTGTPTVLPTPETGFTPIGPISPTAGVTDTTAYEVYQTLFTGAQLEAVGRPAPNQRNEYEIYFQLYDEGAQIFEEFTSFHAPLAGEQPSYPVCIVLDKVVVSCPVIASTIPDGVGSISLGSASYEQANSLYVQLHYGALPVPLRVETTDTIGPTLGERSVDQSVRAGIVGLSVVLLFMLVYYRLPGALAAVALLIYAAINLAFYKLTPVTLTLPSIAGFLLSAGMAVDANILVFERMKEELRAGRTLKAAIESGFGRAWTSIRDSQFSTIIVCIVLWFFGRNFGASMVQGFATTLFIGTVVNIFTAVFATRTFVRLVFHLAGDWLASRRWLLGV
jgi:protein-export membrane protein SecD